MSGTLSFGNDLVVVVNNAGMGVIDRLLKPDFAERKDINEKIYFHYDLYDGPIDFTELTSEQYMEAYEIMQKVFEEDLKENAVIDEQSRKWAADFWFNEIKPKMQRSILYKS